MVKINIPIFLQGPMIHSDKETPVRAIIKGAEFLEEDELGFKLKNEKLTGKYQLMIEIENTTYAWTANDTSLRNFITAWGQDSDAWIGREIVLWTKSQDVFGAIKEVIYGAPVK